MSDNFFEKATRLTKLLDDELKLLENIKELTDEQTRQIEMDEFDGLEKLLERRQELIEKINGLHQESQELMQSYVSSSSLKPVREIENLKEEIKYLLQTCKESNERNIEMLSHKSTTQKEKIGKQSAQRKGIGGYAQAVPTSSEMFDKKT
ncbi:MAG: flagellar export chaperone FlgN [Oscillospiraceae bacterium]|nr:flagellar export chaperone FlgN [Oscillospiraceae bacterium]